MPDQACLDNVIEALEKLGWTADDKQAVKAEALDAANAKRAGAGAECGREQGILSTFSEN